MSVVRESDPRFKPPTDRSFEGPVPSPRQPRSLRPRARSRSRASPSSTRTPAPPRERQGVRADRRALVVKAGTARSAASGHGRRSAAPDRATRCLIQMPVVATRLLRCFVVPCVSLVLLGASRAAVVSQSVSDRTGLDNCEREVKKLSAPRWGEKIRCFQGMDDPPSETDPCGTVVEQGDHGCGCEMGVRTRRSGQRPGAGLSDGFGERQSESD